MHRNDARHYGAALLGLYIYGISGSYIGANGKRPRAVGQAIVPRKVIAQTPCYIGFYLGALPGANGIFCSGYGNVKRAGVD